MRNVSMAIINKSTHWQARWLFIIAGMTACAGAWGLEEIVVTAQKRE